MPSQVQLQPGPVIEPATGRKVYYGVEILERTTLIDESPTPTRVERDLTPPECWERKEFERLLWTVERVLTHTFEAVEKANWAFRIGVGLLIGGAVVFTGGAAALVVIVAKGAAIAAAGVAVGTMGVGGAMVGGGGQLVKNPDEFEPGRVLATTGPSDVKIPPPQQLPPRTEYAVIPCQEPTEPTGGSTSGPGTGTGTVPVGGSGN